MITQIDGYFPLGIKPNHTNGNHIQNLLSIAQCGWGSSNPIMCVCYVQQSVDQFHYLREWLNNDFSNLEFYYGSDESQYYIRISPSYAYIIEKFKMDNNGVFVKYIDKASIMTNSYTFTGALSKHIKQKVSVGSIVEVCFGSTTDTNSSLSLGTFITKALPPKNTGNKQ